MISRRDFSKMIGAVGLTGLPTFAWSGSTLDGPMPAVVDCSVHSDAEAQRLKDLGVKVVFRYYALKSQPEIGVTEKILKKEEANRILDAGLSLGLTYQYYNGSLGSFTPERGSTDAGVCLESLGEISAPKGVAIYFGVDHDWVSKSDTDKVIEYFKAVKAGSKGQFEVGVYGSGFTCMLMKRLDLAQYFWIAGLSDGWTGRFDAVKDGTWNMYQNVLELPVGAIKVDTNVVNPKHPVIGSFHRRLGAGACVLDGSITDDASVENQRFVVRDTTLFLDKPNGDKKKALRASKMVALIGQQGDYSIVDVPAQIGSESNKVADFVRGFCKTSMLKKITAQL